MPVLLKKFFTFKKGNQVKDKAGYILILEFDDIFEDKKFLKSNRISVVRQFAEKFFEGEMTITEKGFIIKSRKSKSSNLCKISATLNLDENLVALLALERCLEGKEVYSAKSQAWFLHLHFTNGITKYIRFINGKMKLC